MESVAVDVDAELEKQLKKAGEQLLKPADSIDELLAVLDVRSFRFEFCFRVFGLFVLEILSFFLSRNLNLKKKIGKINVVRFEFKKIDTFDI